MKHGYLFKNKLNTPKPYGNKTLAGQIWGNRLLDNPPQTLERNLKRLIACAAGTEAFVSGDAVYNVSESFSRSYPLKPDKIAGLATQALAGEQGGEASAPSWDETPFSIDGGAFKSFGGFARAAFKRGELEGETLEKGLMLTASLKRAAGQPRPLNAKELKLEAGCNWRQIAGGSRVLFNAGSPYSAVGLASPSRKDALKALETLEQRVRGKYVSSLPGEATLKAVYPFLSDVREQELLGKYRALSKSLEGVAGAQRQKAVLDKAAAKTQALIERKRFMRLLFKEELREIIKRSKRWEKLESFSLSNYGELSEPAAQEDGGENI